MKVIFYDDYRVVINEDTLSKLGDLLIDFISRDFSYFYVISRKLIKELKDVSPDNHLDTPLGLYLDYLKEANKLEQFYYEILTNLPFYNISKPEYTFATEILIDITNANIQGYSDKTLLGDAHFNMDFNQIKVILKDIVTYGHIITECSSLFPTLSAYCLIGEDISPIERLNAFGLDKVINKITQVSKYSPAQFSVEHKIGLLNKKPVLTEVYDINTPIQFLYHEFIALVKNNLRIKECANCGKYFVVFSGHSLEYCDNTPEGETKPCNVIGPNRVYARKLKDDPILEHYTRSYKTHFARKRSGHLTDDQFKKWSKEAKTMRKRAYAKEISLDDFINWCKV